MDFCYIDINHTKNTTEEWQFLDIGVFEVVFNGLLTSSIAIFGIAGNIYAIFLLRMKYRIRRTIALYLRTLAFWDLCLLSCTLTYFSLHSMMGRSESSVFDYLTIISHPLIGLCMAAVTWMLITIAVDRYHAIVKMNRRSVLKRKRTVKRVCTGIAIASAIYNLPAVFELKVAECWSLTDGQVHTFVTGSTLRTNFYFKTVYRAFFGTIFISFGPIFLMLGLTAATINKAWKDKNQPKENTPLLKKEHPATSLLLLTLVCKFLICNSLPAVLNIWELFLIRIGYDFADNFRFAVDISNLLVVVNSSTNFAVYLKFQSSFIQNVSNNHRLVSRRNAMTLPGSVTNSMTGHKRGNALGTLKLPGSTTSIRASITSNGLTAMTQPSSPSIYSNYSSTAMLFTSSMCAKGSEGRKEVI